MVLCCASISGCAWVTSAIGRKTVESQTLSQQAKRAEDKGDFQRATQLLTQALAVDPSNSDLHRQLAKTQLALGNRKAAMEQLRYAVTTGAEDAAILTELAGLYFDAGEFERASRTVDSALQQDASLVRALVLSGELHERQGNREQADVLYHRVLEIDSENPHAKLQIALNRLRASQPEQAAPLLRSICQCRQSCPLERVQARWALGISYGQMGRWDDAATEFATALPQLKRPTADEWYHLAYAQNQAGQRQNARENLDRALQLDPEHPRAIAMTHLIARPHGIRDPSMAPRVRFAAVVERRRDAEPIPIQ